VTATVGELLLLLGTMTLWQLDLDIRQDTAKKDSDSDQSELVFKGPLQSGSSVPNGVKSAELASVEYSNNETAKIYKNTSSKESKGTMINNKNGKMNVEDSHPSNHILALIILQIIIITFFCFFVRYDPKTAQRSPKSVEDGSAMIHNTYGMFQDVHVMIFIGFGFLMTFLKRYGLSAVSLNLMCSALAIEVFILVYGFFHLHCGYMKMDYDSFSLKKIDFSSPDCENIWPYIDVNIESLISADFATAAVLISFGVVLGITSPLQLIIMTVIETIIFVVNEFIGRNYIGAVDAGDTIFVHLFGACFGLAVGRVLYNPQHMTSNLEGSSYTSDLFSMVGTIFLWMFWPSFNAGAAASGDAQQRAVINTYFSLCSCVLATFIFSALITPSKRFKMEHLQNATLAGGVAVGACADMMLTPGGALIIGSLAGILSVCGFDYIGPFLQEKLNIHDTCGVNNLHGMPGLLGGLLSVLMAGIASPSSYDTYSGVMTKDQKSLIEIFPSLGADEEGSAGSQALAQLLAVTITMLVAVVGGLATGLIMYMVGKMEKMGAKDYYNDQWNIDGIEEDTGEGLKLLKEDLKSAKSNGYC